MLRRMVHTNRRLVVKLCRGSSERLCRLLVGETGSLITLEFAHDYVTCCPELRQMGRGVKKDALKCKLSEGLKAQNHQNK